MAALESLTRERVLVEAIDWTSKSVRTGGPSGPLHEEWALTARFLSDQPFRGAAFLDYHGTRYYSQDWARHAETAAVLTVHFFPYNWDSGDQVQIAAGGARVEVESESLKSDPVNATVLRIGAGDEGCTGEAITVLTIPRLDAVVGVVLVRSTDTKADRTRWHVRSGRTGGLDSFHFLASGRRSGSVPL